MPAAQGSGSGSRPPRAATKGYKVKRYPPAPEDLDMDEGDFEEAPAPPPVESATPAAPAPTRKSSGSLKSILLLVGLLLLAGAAVAVYQMFFSGQ